LPALITAGELLADQTFVDFNRNYVRQKIQGVIGQLEGHTLKPLPALFFKLSVQPAGQPERIYAYALSPNPANMQWDGPRAWIPKQYSASTSNEPDVFMKNIRDTIESNGGTANFIEDWENFHIRFGEVHCGSNARRSPPADWWAKLQ
jgi:protein-arginine deiminase